MPGGYQTINVVFNKTKNQASPSNETATKASPNIVFLRTVMAYLVENVCVDSKIKIPIHIHIHIHIINFI